MKQDSSWLSSYLCGWNDAVYGLLTCTSGAQTIKYIYDMRKAIVEVNTSYSAGAEAAIKKALSTGIIPERRERKPYV
jgi:hypothetical protein